MWWRGSRRFYMGLEAVAIGAALRLLARSCRGHLGLARVRGHVLRASLFFWMDGGRWLIAFFLAHHSIVLT